MWEDHYWYAVLRSGISFLKRLLINRKVCRKGRNKNDDDKKCLIKLSLLN